MAPDFQKIHFICVKSGRFHNCNYCQTIITRFFPWSLVQGLFMGDVTQSQWGGGTPVRASGYTPGQSPPSQAGVPVPSQDWGTPQPEQDWGTLPRDSTGVSPSQDWVTPQSRLGYPSVMTGISAARTGLGNPSLNTGLSYPPERTGVPHNLDWGTPSAIAGKPPYNQDRTGYPLART